VRLSERAVWAAEVLDAPAERAAAALSYTLDGEAVPWCEGTDSAVLAD
jgi:hypothetical protein